MRPSQGFWGTAEKDIYCRGTKAKFEGNRGTKTILGNRHLIFDFWGTGEKGNKPIYFRGTGTTVEGPQSYVYDTA